MLAYTGAFEARFRGELEREWVKKLDELELKHSEEISMRSFLGNDVKI